MSRTGEGIDATVAATLSAEMRLIREAILFVASGHSSRVVVAGLAFGESLLQSARTVAAEHGVSIQPMWSADESGASLAVVRAEDAP